MDLGYTDFNPTPDTIVYHIYRQSQPLNLREYDFFHFSLAIDILRQPTDKIRKDSRAASLSTTTPYIVLPMLSHSGYRGFNWAAELSLYYNYRLCQGVIFRKNHKIKRIVVSRYEARTYGVAAGGPPAKAPAG